jgi:uncharacterized membrane protein
MDPVTPPACDPVDLDPQERRVADALRQGTAISRDVQTHLDAERTFGERIADRIASFGGSWTFILACIALLTAWIIFNLTLGGGAFDPFPFILLNLALSMLAALQAPVILMSQNRQAARDRADAAHDYEVNLKAELEIRYLHEKVDLLREQQWSDLVQMQQRQIEMLERLLRDARAEAHDAPVSDP